MREFFRASLVSYCIFLTTLKELHSVKRIISWRFSVAHQYRKIIFLQGIIQKLRNATLLNINILKPTDMHPYVCVSRGYRMFERFEEWTLIQFCATFDQNPAALQFSILFRVRLCLFEISVLSRKKINPLMPGGNKTSYVLKQTCS